MRGVESMDKARKGGVIYDNERGIGEDVDPTTSARMAASLRTPRTGDDAKAVFHSAGGPPGPGPPATLFDPAARVVRRASNLLRLRSGKHPRS